MSTYPNEALRQKLKKLPKNPGVYFHKSADGTVIYVGKASNLKNRVSSYFRGEHDTKTEALVHGIFTTDWIETDSEIDALFLESEMIKRYMPQFNILLRDDKTSIFVRISFNEAVPTVTTSRTPNDDGAEYIGPFYSSAELKRSLRYLRKVFPYFTKRQDSYSKLPTQLGVVPTLFMKNASGGQPIVDPAKLTDYRKNLRTLVRYLRGERVKIQTELTKEMHDLAQKQKFEAAAKLRNQLRYLNELKKQIIFGREEFMDVSRDQALQSLKTTLDLPKIPRRIEAYDVSHISGTNVVASMVVATNGVMDRREYRKFKLSRQINDDTANLREVLQRRMRHDNWIKPDLVVLDGGKPQVSAVRNLLDDQKIAFIGRDKSGDHSGNADMKIIIPLTKDGDKNDNFRELSLNKTSHIAMLIARLDEESHRFAITYHQNLRAKAATKNALEEIPGIGPATRKKLLRKFGSLKTVRASTETELAGVVGSKLAAIIKNNL
ncbi:MAG: excinuclease ABC subunit UvrC [Candidatus Nanoperiomorbaceae bacterium]